MVCELYISISLLFKKKKSWRLLDGEHSSLPSWERHPLGFLCLQLTLSLKGEKWLNQSVSLEEKNSQALHTPLFPEEACCLFLYALSSTISGTANEWQVNVVSFCQEPLEALGPLVWVHQIAICILQKHWVWRGSIEQWNSQWTSFLLLNLFICLFNKQINEYLFNKFFQAPSMCQALLKVVIRQWTKPTKTLL